MKMIILAGMPATGKSTLAKKLAVEFGYPIIEKDNIKEGLFDVLGFENYARKRRLDEAANMVLLRMTEAMIKGDCSVIIDNNFDAESGRCLCELIERYQPDCVTIFLGGNIQTLYERYVDRDEHHRRHLGHILQDHYPPMEGETTDYRMSREEFDEKFVSRGMDKFHCPGARITVDMTCPEQVDIDALVKEIRGMWREEAYHEEKDNT